MHGSLDGHYLRGQDECTNQNPLACPPLVGYFELGSHPFQVYESDEDDRNIDAGFVDQVERQLKEGAGNSRRSSEEVGGWASQGEVHSFNCCADEIVYMGK